MRKKSTVFAKWDFIIELIVKKYEEELCLPSTFCSHYKDQFRILKDIHVNGSMNLDSLRTLSTFPLTANKIQSNEFQEFIIDGLKAKGGLDDNQFITIGNSSKENFMWIDDRISDVLKIPKANFSFSGLLGIDNHLNLHHPMDVAHYIRYRTLIYFINSLKGIEFTALKDYYMVKYRIGQKIDMPETDVLKSTKLIEQKCFGLVGEHEFNNPSNGIKDPTYHLDIWTVSENHEKQNFVSTNLEFIGNATKSKFANMLFYISNAKLLGFKPKEIAVLHYLNIYDTSEESRSRINRQIRLKSGDTGQFENKAFTDFSYLLNRKLTVKLKELSMNSENNTQYFSSLNRLSKARRLGLLPLHRELEDAILSSVG